MNDRFATIAARGAPAVFVLLWCTGFIFSKLAQLDAGPLTALAWRMGVTVPLMLTIALVARAHWPGWRGAGHSAVAGLLLHGLYVGGVFVAIAQGVPAGLSALIPGLQPILTSTLASRFLGERVSAIQWLGLVLGLVGVLLVLHERSVIGGASLVGWIASIVSLFAITVGTLYQKHYCSHIDWRTGNTLQYVAAAALFIILATFVEGWQFALTARFALSVTYMTLVLSVGTVSILYWLIRNSAATEVASLFYLVPGVTAVMAYFLFGERLDHLAIVGMVVCAAGVFLVNWRGAKPA